MLTSRSAKPCCSNCQTGKPCCGTKPRPAFEKRRGLWLPRRDLTLPKNLLQHPSEAEWSGLWRPWVPPLAQVLDFSCYPCCQPGDDCHACDPGADDAGAPMSYDDLTGVFTGGVTGTDVLSRDFCPGAGINWNYGNGLFAVAGCGDAGWINMSVCIYCDDATDQVYGVFAGGSAGCTVLELTAIPADSWTCDPFEAVFTLHTNELFGGGCPCGDNVEITFTVSE